jgi:hypothetical protein
MPYMVQKETKARLHDSTRERKSDGATPQECDSSKPPVFILGLICLALYGLKYFLNHMVEVFWNDKNNRIYRI